MFNSVVKDSCFKNLQDIIPTYAHYVTMLLSHNQPCFQHIIFALN